MLVCVFLMGFDVWICSMIWEVINSCGGVVGGWNGALFGDFGRFLLV